MIAFSCQRCATHFKVPDSLAGKKAHCKKCGESLRVPQAPAALASVAATGIFRMGAVYARSGVRVTHSAEGISTSRPAGHTESAAGADSVAG